LSLGAIVSWGCDPTQTSIPPEGSDYVGRSTSDAEESALLKPLGPNRADEPMAEKISLTQAADFLDAASLRWTRQRRCGTCHTNYPYLMARPAIRETSSPALAEVRDFFERRIAFWERGKPRWDAEVVYTATSMAYYDAQTAGRLHPLTRKALDRIWTLQRDDGSWNWLKFNNQPAEADDFFGVVIDAIGVGAAPEAYAETPAARAGLAKMRAYFETHSPPSLHHQVLLLWASCRLPALMASDQRDATLKELLTLQRADGGWSLPSLGDGSAAPESPTTGRAPSATDTPRDWRSSCFDRQTCPPTIRPFDGASTGSGPISANRADGSRARSTRTLITTSRTRAPPMP
jgi:squalene-hopene/tetraprenyl-beta-curcumene cyclase